MKEFKDFSDLVFEPHRFFSGLEARMSFPNGYGVSVVRFKMLRFSIGEYTYGSYTNNENEWELAVLHNDTLDYDTPITNDVMGHLVSTEVTEVMKRVQELPARVES